MRPPTRVLAFRAGLILLLTLASLWLTMLVTTVPACR